MLRTSRVGESKVKSMKRVSKAGCLALQVSTSHNKSHAAMLDTLHDQRFKPRRPRYLRMHMLYGLMLVSVAVALMLGSSTIEILAKLS